MVDDALHAVDVTTADPGVAEQVVRSSFPGIELTPGGDAAVSFRLAHRRVSDGVFAVNRLSLIGRAASRGEFPEIVAAGRVRRGRYAVDYGPRSLDTTRPYLRPGGRQRTRFQNVSLDLLTVEPAGFAQRAASHLEGSGAVLRPLTVETSVPVSADAEALWHATLDHITAVAETPEVFALPLIRAELLERYVATLLEVFPLTRDRGSALGSKASPDAVQRAIRFMEEHLADPITAPMIAEAARLSVRGLQEHFAARLGTTPMRHLRQLRMHAAHDDLLAADPVSGITTTAIANRWGFTHLSRFAQQYRDTFGELPSRTLRR